MAGTEKKQTARVKKTVPAVKPLKEAQGSEGGNFFEGIGRRKTASARVRIVESPRTTVQINEQTLAQHFQSLDYQDIAVDSLSRLGAPQKFQISIRVAGGGKRAQAEAVRLGLARALVQWNSEFRSQLKDFGFMTRDPRRKERKKFGLKSARRARQWRKR